MYTFQLYNADSISLQQRNFYSKGSSESNLYHSHFRLGVHTPGFPVDGHVCLGVVKAKEKKKKENLLVARIQGFPQNMFSALFVRLE